MRRLALYQPRTNQASLWTDFDHAFDSFWSADRHSTQQANFLAVDTEETETDLKLNFDLPGVRKEDLKIEFHNGVLTLSGERKQETKSENAKYKVQERVFGKFTRSFSLPDGLDTDRIEAKYQDGVLQVSIQKTPETKAKAIPIN